MLGQRLGLAQTPGLDLELAFSLGALQWVMVLVVAGIGVLVMAYSASYFSPGTPGLVGFTTSFTAFVGAMLGLVLADDLIVLVVFWELTTVSSFLLIGFEPTKRASRLAAMEALLEHLARQPGYREAVLSYEPENAVARRLYTSLGFVETGERVDDELVARHAADDATN